MTSLPGPSGRAGASWLAVGVACLLWGIPWHELIVRLAAPLGAWDEGVLLALAVALVFRGRGAWRPCAFLPPLLALAGFQVAWILWEGGPWLPLRAWLPYSVAGLAASQLDRGEARAVLSGALRLGLLACLYGLVTFAMFRALGGDLQVRPPLGGLHLGWVYPYYSGAVPRSAHLVGPFFNDLYFGVWAVAMGTVAVGRGWGPLGIAPYLAAAALSFSRSAWLALLLAALLLAVRRSWGFLLIPLLGAALAWPWLNAHDQLRFLEPWAPEVFPTGRAAVFRQAWEGLRAGAWFGIGPGRLRLADTQFGKIVVELGWVGLVCLGWLLRAWVWRALGRAGGPGVEVSSGVLILLVAGWSGEILEVPQVALTLWILAGLAEALGRGDGRGPEEAPSGSSSGSSG